MSTKVPPPAPPYLGPAKFHGGPQALHPLKRIVMHCTVSPCAPGGARANANYFVHTVTTPSSAHYVVDPGETVQVVYDHQIAYHAPPNTDTLGVELCDPQTGSPARWGDTNHHAMLLRAAKLVAQLALAYDVPIRKVGSLQLRLGLRGICGHVDVTNAWHQTTHTDPGDGFPWDAFMAMVNQAAKDLQVTPPPPIKPVPPDPHKAGGTGVRLVTSNIKNLPDLSREHVRHDMALVRKLGGVILWQEIAEADDVADLRATVPGYTHLHTDTECPISVWTKGWKVLDYGKVTLHPGKEHVSPHRVATWVRLQRNGSTVPPFVVVNTHWVSGAYSNPGQEAEAWRLAMWAQAHAGMCTLVQGFLAKGITVLGGGDFNRTGAFPGFAPGHRWLINGGYDHLWACEAKGGVQVEAAATGTLGTDKLFTDHAARWAHVHLVAPAKAKEVAA